VAKKRKRATEAQRVDFVRQYLPYVQDIAKQYNIPAHSILGQWALESDWGTVTTGKNNIFGIKSIDPKSKTRVRSQTQEQFTPEELENWKGKLKGREVIKDLGPTEKDKNKYSVYDYFRSFETPEEAIKIKSDFLKRFPKVVGAKDTKAYAEGLLQGTFGPYATDKDYVKKLVKMDSGVLNRINLINAENAKVENKRSGGIVGNMEMQYEKGGMVNQAKGLAALGRGPDTELVHMTPSEVQGLQTLARGMGGGLTVNPNTGLPEAGFLKNIFPMIIGAGLTIGSGGLINPMTAGLLMGGGALAASGGDLRQGLKYGLGGYGGAGLAGSLSAAGSAATPGQGLTTGLSTAARNTAVQTAKNTVAPSLGNVAKAFSTEGLKNVFADEALKRSAMAGVGSLALNQPKLTPNTPLDTEEDYFYPEGGYKSTRTPINVAAPQRDASGNIMPRMGEATYFDPNNLGITQVNPNAGNVYDIPNYQFNEGGIVGYANGGLTAGPGDGMSDDIPAVIAGEQPAALSPGEFVVPADVVSDMGNGSSRAGARQLYSMMDRVRKARGGSVEQPKAINPNEYMPA